MKIFQKNKYSILTKIINYGFIFVIISSLAVPFFAVNACGKPGEPACPTAGSDNTNQIPAGSDNTIKTPADNTKSSGTKINTGIGNPLENAGVSDITSFIESILRFVVMIGIPIITLAIIYSGFLFVVARGNPEELKKAKKTFLYTLVGAALLLGSFVIANAIKGTVDQIKS